MLVRGFGFLNIEVKLRDTTKRHFQLFLQGSGSSEICVHFYVLLYKWFY